MENSVQQKIKDLSDEIKEIATQIQAEKDKAQAIMHNAESTSDAYDEDDFTNLINGYQYTIDELKSAYKHLYEAHVQYKFLLEDHNIVRNKGINLSIFFTFQKLNRSYYRCKYFIQFYIKSQISYFI